MEVSIFMKIGSILLAIGILVGIVANGFIVLMNYIDWFRSRKLSPNDHILTCLGLTRIAWLAIAILDKKNHLFSVDTPEWRSMLIIPTMWILTNTSTVWFATWLSVFYLAKIATFSHPVFLQVKQRISGLVPWLLLGSTVFSAMVAIAIVTSVSNGFSGCDSEILLLNINNSKIKFPDPCMYMPFLAIVPNFIPLMIFLSSSILLMTSLWMHTRHLQHNGIGVSDLNTQVHLTAIKTLASFTVLYLSSFLAVTAKALLTWRVMGDPWLYIVLNNVAVSYPSGHAILLILTNTKLKQVWVRMLLGLKSCSSETPS